MLSLFKIWTVALYEIKTLMRSWFFRIFSLLALVILIFLNFFFFVSPRSAMWTLRGIPSSIPYMNLLLLNIVQAIIGIFMASDFFKFDKKLDTTDVIYMRSMTNADYVLGKSLGVFALFFFLNILILLVALVFNVFFVDVPFVPISYLYYPLFISIPTLIFVFGLSFLSMALIRSQAVTFIILLGYIATTLFFLGNKFHYLFDYMTFNIPLMYSDFVGFGNISTVLIHRGIYLLLGLGFIFTTILLLKRLPQSRIMTRISFILAVLFIGGALLLGNIYLLRISSGRKLRQEMAALNEHFAEEPKISTTDCNLDLIHLGEEIEVKTDIKFRNNTSSAIDTYIFSLNPGLEIQKVVCNGENLSFNRNLHILTVEPSAHLNSGDVDSLSIFYRGKINEEACYTDIGEDEREENYRVFIYNIDKRYGFITPQYVLLTHENLWYPVTGIPYGSAYPKIQSRDFINFELTVTTDSELTALSQGNLTQSDNGKYVFKPEVALPQLSLTIGRYEKRSITVEDMDYTLFIMTGHDYFSQYFNELGEKLPELISEFKQDFERNLKLSYPYKRFSLVEVPIQFYCYERLWTLSQETVQPEQVFLPEKGILLFSSDFKRSQYFQQRHGGMGRRDIVMTPEEIQSDLFRGFINRTLTGDSPMRGIARAMRGSSGGSILSRERIFSSLLPSLIPSYDIFPNFYSFTNHFNSIEWPIFNISLENYLKSGIGNTNFFRAFMGISNVETANIALIKQNLSEILSGSEEKEVIYDVLSIKADYLFALIKAGLGDETFEEFLYEFLTDTRFKNMNARDFLDLLKERFEFDLEPYFDQWYNERLLPVFIVTDQNCTEILDEEKTRYQVTFTVYNPESVDGIISAGFNTLAMLRGGPGGRGGPFMGMGAGGASDQIERYYTIKGNETKKIGIVLDEAPRSIRFNTFISQNLPASFDRVLPKPELDEDAVAFDDELIMDRPTELVEPGEIIVDNEDTGFEILAQTSETYLMKLINNKNIEDDEYIGFNFWRPPNRWQATAQDDFYGAYKHTAYFIKTGAGNQKVQWNAEIPESGKYDIYYYTPNSRQFVRMREGGRGGGDRRMGGRMGGIEDMNFIIYHDDGIDETTLELSSESANEWSYLGTFYLSKGTAKVELTDKSKGRVVYADAVKWSINK